MSDRSQDDISIVWDDVREPNWDGYGAIPVAREALRNARLLIDSLPGDLPAPSFGAEPDGHLTLEWHRNARFTL